MTGPSPPPDAVAPPPRHPRFPLVDGLRAIAVLCVVVLHVGIIFFGGSALVDRVVNHLNVGVTIFFLISGFLLYRPFIAARTGGPRAPWIGDYLRRRALRILPAYWLVLTVVVLIPGLTATSDGHWIQQYALLFSLSSSGGWTCSDCVLTQTWSLVVEVTFYALLPIYALCANRLARGRPVRAWLPIEAALLVGIAAGSIVLQFAVYDGRPPSLVGGSLLSYGLWFALGMGLAVSSVVTSRETRGRGWPLRPGVAEGMWLGAIGVYVVLSIALPADPIVFDAGQQLIAFIALGVVALLLLIPAATASGRAGLPGRLLAWRPLTWLGLVSYGVFLWHVLVIRVLLDAVDGWTFASLLPVTLAISVAIAAASYYCVERPLLRFKYRAPSGARDEPAPVSPSARA